MELNGWRHGVYLLVSKRAGRLCHTLAERLLAMPQWFAACLGRCTLLHAVSLPTGVHGPMPWPDKEAVVPPSRACFPGKHHHTLQGKSSRHPSRQHSGVQNLTSFLTRNWPKNTGLGWCNEKQLVEVSIPSHQDRRLTSHGPIGPNTEWARDPST